MQTIPLQAVESQIVTCLLGGQYCQINVYQKAYGVFLDLYIDNVLIIGGVICQNLNPIVRSAYLGFQGDLMFVDSGGSADPDWTGLAGRFVLLYLSPAEMAAYVAVLAAPPA